MSESEEIKFEDYIGMMKKIANSFQITTNLEFEELLSTAYETFVRAQKTYKPDKSQFSTYLWRMCEHELINFCGRTMRQNNNATDLLSNTKELRDPESAVILKDLLTKNLRDESKEICEMVFKNPEEFLVAGRPKLSRGKVKDALRNMGWSWSQIWTGFRDIKTTLTQIE